MKNRRNLVLKNSMYSVLDQFLGMFLALFVSVAIARLFGPEDLGKYNLSLALASLISVVTNFGIQSYVKREVAKQGSLTGFLLGQSILIRLLISLPLSAVAVHCVSLLLGYDLDLIFFTHVINLYVFASGLLALNSGVLDSLHHSKEVLRCNLLYRILLIVSLAFVAALRGTIDHYALLLVTASLIPVLLSSYRIGKLANPPIYKIDLLKWKIMIVTSAPLMLAAAAEFANLKISTLLLGYYYNETEVGLYSAAFSVLLVSVLVPLAVTKVLFPNFIQVFHSESRLRAFEFLKLYAISFCLYGILVAVFLSLFSEFLINTIYGFGFERASVALGVLGIGVPFIVLNRLFNYILVAVQKDKNFFVINFIGLIVNLVLNVAFLPKHSIFGAAVATVITELFVMCIGGWLLFRYLGSSSIMAEMDRAL